MTSRNDALWRLQQIAQLHLSHPLLIAAFLSEIHKLVPSYANSFFWLDKQGHILNVYDERVPQHLINQIGHFLHHADLPALDCLREWIVELNSPQQPVKENQSTPDLRYLYRHTFFKVGYYQSLFIPVFNNAKKTGILVLHREAKAPQFDQHEINLAAEAVETLAKGLNQSVNLNQLMVNGFEEGLITLDNQGRIQNICTTAAKLLSLAIQKPGIRPLENDTKLDLSNFIGLDKFIKQLLDENNSDVNKSDLYVSTMNQWGEFKLTGFVIHDAVGRRAPQICLNLKWMVPFSLYLFQRIEQLQLTPRQETIALLYAVGHPTKTMANMLDLSLYTVKEHVQNIFERLNIHSRAELIELIVCED